MRDHKSPEEAAVDDFLSTPVSSQSSNPSLSASVPPALRTILRNTATLLRERAPGREYTAQQIAAIVIDVYTRRVDVPDEYEVCPEILHNMRAFGRYLQKHGGREIGFEASGSVNNRRTYKPQPLSQKVSPLDS